MLVGDKISVNLITEQAGVAMVNTLYYDVVDATLATTLEAALLEIATAFNTALGTARSSSAVLTCATWTNLNGNDPFTQTFFNLPGAGSAAALPTESSVRVRRYATPGARVNVGAIYVAGVVESLVQRGRLVADGTLGTIASFLENNIFLAAGPQLSNGFWVDTTTPSPAFVFTDAAHTVSRIRTLERRQSKLCGQ